MSIKRMREDFDSSMEPPEQELQNQLNNIRKRLDALGGKQEPQSAPAPKLVEAVDGFLAANANQRGSEQEDWTAHNRALEQMRLALAREKERQELVNKLIGELRRNPCRHSVGYGNKDCNVCCALDTLDAFDNQDRRDSDKDGGK